MGWDRDIIRQVTPTDANSNWINWKQIFYHYESSNKDN